MKGNPQVNLPFSISWKEEVGGVIPDLGQREPMSLSIIPIEEQGEEVEDEGEVE